jgi:hypothetical protein
MKLPEKFSKSALPTNFLSTFFTEKMLAKPAEEKNLYSSQTNLSNPINCTVYDTNNFLEIVLFILLPLHLMYVTSGLMC